MTRGAVAGSEPGPVLVMVIGAMGSGKTSLARWLAAAWLTTCQVEAMQAGAECFVVVRFRRHACCPAVADWHGHLPVHGRRRLHQAVGAPPRTDAARSGSSRPGH